MSTLTYNGVVIGEPFEILEYARDVVTNGPDYLYTVHRLRVRGVYNPRATSYDPPTNGAPPTAQPGTAAPRTDFAIRHQLSQPRRQLALAIGAGADPTTYHHVLTAPDFVPDSGGQENYPVDANNGPKPIGNPVVEAHGVKTWKVEFAVECAVNEADLYVDTPTALLSHRWTMQQSFGVDALCTRTVTGRAIFRSDRLAAESAKPDDFRAYLFPPIPTGFKREVPNVEVDEDNLSLSYTVVDREQILCIQDPNLSRFRMKYLQRQTAPGGEQLVWSTLSSWTNLGKQALSTFGLGKNKLSVGDVAGVVDTATGEFGNGMRQVPRRHHFLVVTCWGANGVNPDYLQGLCEKIIGDRLSAFALNMGTYDFGVEHELATDETAVTVSVQLSSGPVSFVTGNVNIGNLTSTFTGTAFPKMDMKSGKFGGVLTPQLLGGITGAQTTVKQVLAADNARGTYLGSLVAAALLDPNGVPAQPTDPPKYTASTPP